MTVRELTGNMWYSQRIRLVTSVEDYFTNVEERTVFYGENMTFRSELNKKYLDYKVLSFGVVDGDIVAVVRE